MPSDTKRLLFLLAGLLCCCLSPAGGAETEPLASEPPLPPGADILRAGAGDPVPQGFYPALQAGPFLLRVQKAHPRLWLTPARLALLRRKAETESFDFLQFRRVVDTYYLPRRTSSPGWGREDPSSLALLWHATGRREYLARARDDLLEIARQHYHSSLKGNGMALGGAYFPLAFDWLYNDLSESERKECQEELERGLQALKPGTTGLRWDDSGQMVGEWAAATLSALALTGHSDAGEAGLKHFLGPDSQWRAVRQFLAQSQGGLPRGGSEYGAAVLQQVLLAGEGLRVAGGIQLPADPPFASQVAYGMIYGSTPDGAPIPYGDMDNLDEPLWWRRVPPQSWPLAGLALGALDPAGKEAALLHNFVEETLGRSPLANSQRFALGYDPTAPERDYTRALPLDYYAPGQGFIIARSGWGPSATLVTFQCSGGPPDHAHADQGSFMLYRKGWWLSKELSGYGGFAAGPRAHNGMLFWNLGAPRPAAKIIGFHSSPHYTYAVASADGPYGSQGIQPPSVVTRYTRTLLYLKPDLVVILDRSQVAGRPETLARPEAYAGLLETGTPDDVRQGRFSREFLLHLPVRPEMRDGILAARLEAGRQTLYAKTLLPRDTATDTVDLKGELGRLYGEQTDHRAPLVERTWMTRTHANHDPEDAGVFLTVLYAADGDKPMPPVRLLEAPSLAGIDAEDAGTRWRVWLSTQGPDAAEIHIEKRGQPVCSQTVRCVTGKAPGG